MFVDNSRFINAFRELVAQKNVSQKVISEILSEAITKAFLKEDPDSQISVDIDLEKGTFVIQRLKKVVSDDQEDYDDFNEITLKEANARGGQLQVGDFFHEDISLDKIERNTARYIHQFFTQRLNELLNKAIAEEWVSKVGEVIVAEVEKNDEVTKSVIVNIGKTNGYVGKKYQIPNETLVPGKQYKFIVEKVKEQSKDWPIVLSRTSNKLVEYELGLEIPEIAEKKIKIVKIVRAPGFKTKVAISCDFPGIDPIGSCLGPQGSRVKRVSSQLNDEKIDIVLWDDDPKKMVVNASRPVQIVGIEIVSADTDKKTMTLIVKDEKDLFAIVGKGGKNIKLLTQLIGWGIDVVTKAQADEQGIVYEPMVSSMPMSTGGFHKKTTRPLSEFMPEKIPAPAPEAGDVHSFTTIIKNDNDIEIDITEETTPPPQPEPVVPEPVVEEPIVEEPAVDSAVIPPETESVVSPMEKDLESVEATASSVTPVDVTPKKPKQEKAKKRSSSNKKIDLSDLSLDFFEGEGDQGDQNP